MSIFKTKTIANDWVRALSSYVLVVAQCFILYGASGQGCGGPPPPPPPVDTGTPDGGSPDGSGSPAPDDSTPPPADTVRPISDLSGWWVIRVGESGSTWGNANAYVVSAVNNEATFSIDLDDRTEPFLTVKRNADESLTGTWFRSIADISLTEINWRGSESADHNTLTGTWTSPTGDLPVTLYRANTPDYRSTGVWTRSSDSATTIIGCNGISFLMSVLNATGDWPAAGRYDLQNVTSPRLNFTGYEGLLFANGTRLHMRPTTGSGVTQLFDKSATQSSLNGRWVGGDRRWEGLTPRRSARIVVHHNNTLYMHDALDSNSTTLTRSLRAKKSGSHYKDTAAGWTGDILPDNSRIVGAWDGHDDWFNSADRTATPLSDDLVGTWYSISIDWNHHDSSGDYLRTYGTAVLTWEGNTLRITDTLPGGVTYNVEATWVGDHFEGLWWNSADPSATSYWRGEMLASGAYLHGTWANGEYSFSAYPILTPSQAASPPAGSTYIRADAYEDVLASASDSEIGAKLLMAQGRISGFQGVSATREVSTTVDSRLRPTRIVDGTDTYTFVWAADSRSATVTKVHAGVSTVSTITPDFSDAGLLTTINSAETKTGRNLAALRQWIADHPGLARDIVEGRTVVPSISGGSHAFGVAISSFMLAPSHTEREVMEGFAEVFGGAAGVIWMGATLSYWTVGITLATCLLATAAITLGVLALACLIIWACMEEEEEQCCPCTLACFTNCCGPMESP